MQCKGKESEAQRKLFEEENRKAKAFLEAASKQHQQLQHKHKRIGVEMKKLCMQFLSETYIASEEGANKEEVQHLRQTTQKLPAGPKETNSELIPGRSTYLPRKGVK
uniref:synaptonemal complex central element protein 1-like n=1 Tax=Halichoerus grypus TaxID=9711 RepID=UPI0016591291|nr:synaptonemal complex central element protein 1-like [Halichoerus grypus]